jgi:hypothetical protein
MNTFCLWTSNPDGGENDDGACVEAMECNTYPEYICEDYGYCSIVDGECVDVKCEKYTDKVRCSNKEGSLQGTLLHVEPNLIWMCLELVYLVSE